MTPAILPLVEIGAYRPLCEHQIRVAAGLATHEAKRGAYRRGKLGIPIDQCGARGDFRFDGRVLCRPHASHEALRLLLADQPAQRRAGDRPPALRLRERDGAPGAGRARHLFDGGLSLWGRCMTPPIKPVLFGHVDGLEPVTFDPDTMFYGSMPCDAHSIRREIADRFDEWARDYEARMTPQQRARHYAVMVGQDWFAERDMKRWLEEAGVRVEDRADGWVLHFPTDPDGSFEIGGPWQLGRTWSGSIDADYAAPPDSWRDLYLNRPAPPEPTGPDYLRHDPTKQHRRARKSGR